MKRWIAIIGALLALTLALHGCGRPTRTDTVVIKGSDTMVNLAQAWAETYTREHPDANITVTGGGSGTGIAALVNGDTDIAAASREMKDKEVGQAESKGIDVREFVVARDGVSFIVNPANPVGKLTISQLSDIYTRTITSWKQIGGRDEKIVVLSRDKSSGTHMFVLEQVVREGDSKSTAEFDKSVLMLPSSQVIADEVAGNEGAIGYVGMGYVDNTRHKAVAVARDAGSPYIEPTPENIMNSTYPIARPLYLYTAGEPKGTIESFIDFALSDEGQKIVVQTDFVPVSSGS